MTPTFRERLASERQHLLAGASLEEAPKGVGTVRFLARCAGDSGTVMKRAKEVLMLVNERGAGEWPADAQWPELLPNWFVDRCAPAQTQEEAETWLAWWKALPPEEQGRVEQQKAWSLDDWLYWFLPENRAWFWWDAVAVDVDSLVVAVETYEWPFPSGSLAWLLRASGAVSVEAEK